MDIGVPEDLGSECDFDRETWLRAREIFHQVVEGKPSERSAIVAQACGEDARLRRMVGALLDADSSDEAEDLASAADPKLPTEVGVGALTSGSIEPGATVAQYRILARLARGGMGEVFRAEDTRLKRLVALKFLTRQWRGDPAAEQRFLYEAQAASALDDPRICTIYEIGETTAGQLFIAMAYSEGETLRHSLQRGPIPAKKAVGIALQLVEGLAAAHGQGIVHRDIKPSNIFLVSGTHVRILDFGIARLVRQVHLTPAGQVAGTPAYMSPEQIRGEDVDPRMDLWGAGVVLYEMLSGRLPFGGDSHHTLMHAILHEEPEPMVELALGEQQEGLGRVLAKALAKDPAQRYPNAKEMAKDLSSILASLISPGTGAGTAGSPARSRSVSRRAMAFTGLALAVTLSVAGWLSFDKSPAPSRLAHIESLVVLPLENLTGDPDEEYFVDGVTTALITHLSKLRVFDVISRTSAMRYRSLDRPVREIAKELNVDAVVEGAVLRNGYRVKIAVQLIDGKTDKTLWAEEYERDLEDTLRLQREVAEDIARALRTEFGGSEDLQLETPRRIERSVLEAYLRGRALWNRRTETDLRGAVEYFELARRLDPSFAEAYAGLADAHLMLGFYGYTAGKDAYARSMVSANQALAIDSTLAEAHATRGAARAFLEYDWVNAEKDLRRAIVLNPSYESGHSFYSGFVLSPLRRFDEAIDQIQEAQRLDPLSPVIGSASAYIHWWAGRDEEALTEVEKVLEFSPRFWLSNAIRGSLSLAEGATASSLNSFEIAVESTHRSPLTLGMLGHTYAVSGRPDRARQILVELAGLSEERYVSPYELALVHLGLGDRDEALALLDQAVDERAAWVAHILVDRRFAPLYGDPHFVALLDRMNLR